MAKDRFKDLLVMIQDEDTEASGLRRRRRSRPSKTASYETDIMKQTLDLAHSIQEDIMRLEDNLFDLKRRQSELLTSPSLQTDHVLTLRMTSQNVRQDAERITRQLLRLETPRLQSAATAAARIMENQTFALRQRVEKVIKDLNLTETEFEEQLIGRVQRHQQIAGVAYNAAFMDTSVDRSSATSLQAPSILLVEDEELKYLRDQEKVLLQTEENVLFVNAMFKDLQFAVHRQQSTVDTIQKKLQRAQSYVESGKKHLQKLNSIKGSGKKISRWKKKVFGISLSVIGTFILTLLLVALL